MNRIQSVKDIIAQKKQNKIVPINKIESFLENNREFTIYSDDNLATGWAPNSISYHNTNIVINSLQGQVKEFYMFAFNKGWRVFAVKQNRGRCYSGKKVITIPVFALCRTRSYFDWYISHELAHAKNAMDFPISTWKYLKPHGDEFMRALKEICPPESIHHEIGYKPQAAIRNGIVPADF